MKKKILKISIILTVVFFLIAGAAFFLMKNATPTETVSESEEDVIGEIVESIEFLKLNTYKELKAYADEYPIYIQESDDKTLFGIGELYIQDNPVKLFYQTNKDGSLNRFDGCYSVTLPEKTDEDVERIVQSLSDVVMDFFNVDFLVVDFYDEQGAPMPRYDKSPYSQMLEGKATYALSAMDEHNTYWYITAKVTNSEQIDIEFFRCFDATQYSVGGVNIDLRPLNETGE